MNNIRRKDYQENLINTLEKQNERLKADNLKLKENNKRLEERILLYENQFEDIESLRKEHLKALHELGDLKIRFDEIISEAMSVKKTFTKESSVLLKQLGKQFNKNV